MDHFIVKKRRVKKLKSKYESLQGRHVSEIVKDMTPDEVAAFQKERYEKFLKPLRRYNALALKKRK